MSQQGQARAISGSTCSTPGRRRPFDSERERVALLWTDTLPRVSETQASDDGWEQVKPHFTEMELVDLTTAIGVINVWNRLNVGFRTQPPIARKQAA